MQQQITHTAKGAIEYRLEGSGPTILVLNGGHCSRDTRLSHERLAECGYSVLTPSRPGYDDTPSDTGRTAQQAADALAALLDTLKIADVDVIGISAAGPTALAFALQYPPKTRKLVLESAVTLRWDNLTRRLSGIGFGRTERLTWGLVKLVLKLAPALMMRVMIQPLTTLDINQVLRRMSGDDIAFIRRMIASSQSGTGFMNDLEHRVDDLSGITVPVLVMYSPYDKAVPPRNAQRVAAEVANSELYEVSADTHLIWIGKSANAVWEKRLEFLRA